MMHPPHVLPDFEAEVRLVPNEAGVMPSVKAGWRTDIRYFEDAPNQAWMVWAIEWLVEGRHLKEFDPIPQVSTAQFAVVSQESKSMHRRRIRRGTEFRIVEGYRTMAVVRVTKILHLNDNADTT